MNASRSIVAALALGILAVSTSAGADGEKGKIKICRLNVPGNAANMVYVPADGNYSGACHADTDCRQITVGVTAGANLPAKEGACVTLDAVLLKSDGHSVNAGESLLPQWNTGSLVSHTTVVQTFK